MTPIKSATSDSQRIAFDRKTTAEESSSRTARGRFAPIVGDSNTTTPSAARKTPREFGTGVHGRAPPTTARDLRSVDVGLGRLDRLLMHGCLRRRPAPP